MKTERKKMGIEKFLSTYFSNLGKFTLVNLIFAVPFAVAFFLCFFLWKLFLPQLTMVIMPLTIVLASPFYSGVVVTTKNIYYDETVFGIFKEYLSAVKENFKAYLVHGVLAYIAFVGCYHGIFIYHHLAKTSGIFYVMFFVSILLSLLLLFLFYGVTMMSAFFDLKLKDVYKNSALMIFGEIKSNFMATICVLAYIAVLSLPLMLFIFLSYVWGAAASVIVSFVYILLVAFIVAPSGVSSIITATLYPDMKRVISGEAKANIEAIRKEDEEEQIKSENNAKNKFSDVSLESLEKSEGDYVFYNGKMIKKSVIIEEIKEREGK